MAAEDEKKEKEKIEVITAVYNVNLHCQQCANDIKKPLLRTQGVHTVEIDMEKGELKVKGAIDPVKIQKQIEKISKRKVELISPKIKAKESVPVEKKVKETKELISRTTSVKVHMHCDKCEQDLRKRLLRHKGIHNVKTDMKAQNLTVEGTIEPEKLLSYLKKKVHKHAEIIKSEKKEEKKEKEKEQEKEKGKPAEKGESKPSEKGEGKPTGKGESKPSEKGEGKPTGKDEGKTTEATKIVEVREEIKVVEVKTKEGNAPYFIHYVYAPQMFSDENPNACSVM
ncbi:heavy metal-associated isoprenylated plant protein 4 [Castanea sativa]|uniref:heavy metal-associated isoprenylated plant protein 4 n=1 Tax=Castanea sativa TaxID=21020 RepID=UPI003F64C5F0